MGCPGKTEPEHVTFEIYVVYKLCTLHFSFISYFEHYVCVCVFFNIRHMVGYTVRDRIIVGRHSVLGLIFEINELSVFKD